MRTKDKLDKLRACMRQVGLDYYLIPSSDPHQNEYVPKYWQRRHWISGFNGSAGDVLVGLDQAYLWTDGRYFLQAKQQLDGSVFTMMPSSQGSLNDMRIWLEHNAQGKVCGVDPKVIPVRAANRLESALKSVGGKLVAVATNLVDSIWADQPPVELQPLELVSSESCGASASDKINQLRAKLKEQVCEAHVLTVLDSIAWLFNIRGTDVSFNPLAISYAVVTHQAAHLFIDTTRINAEQQQKLAEEGITLHDYDQFELYLHELTGRILVDDANVSWWVSQQLTAATLVCQSSPIHMMKACKNQTEIAGMRAAHIADALAVVRYIAWLQQHWQEGYDEYQLVAKLENCRRLHSSYQGKSFSTISAFGPNSAICHYAPVPNNALAIDDSSLYLVDSGGQYHYGTTDVTRTLHLGQPTQEQCHYYTLVLKGHLALRHTIFPQGTTGEHLDAIARQPLWREKLNFAHGTGHGVGAYLCVHEGPQRIASTATGAPLMPGMIVSNEPGVYFANKYGIRIENLCLVTSFSQPEDSATNDGPFYGLEDLTMIPYERKLIDTTMLSAQEIAWVDAYHQRIWHMLHDDLTPVEQQWLEQATKPLASS